MINKFEKFLEEKTEIEKFITMINIDTAKNDLKHVTKMILLLKQIALNIEDNYYGMCLISDIFQMLNLLHYNSERLFYIVYRSAIENSLRFICNLEKEDETSINELFRRVNLLCSKYNAQEYYVFIKHQYKEGCNYAHSNIKASFTLYEYYSDTLQLGLLSPKKIIKLFELEHKFLDRLVDILIKTRIQWIDEAFYRENQKLKFLFSEGQYKNYKECLERNI